MGPSLGIQFMSDLHLESAFFKVDKRGDVLVLAGDIFTCRSVPRFRAFLEETMGLGFRAVLFVLGNHEGYGWTYDEAREELRDREREYDNFYFLDEDVVEIDRVRFLGCPLWSNPNAMARMHAKLYINDYVAVKGWTLEDHIEEGESNREWLQANIKAGDVVITHFPPTRDGTDQRRFAGDVLNDWFTNDLTAMIRNLEPGVWISGHTHHCWHAVDGKTDVVGNCRGYTRRNPSGVLVSECTGFNPIKVVNHRAITNVSDQGSEAVAYQSR